MRAVAHFLFQLTVGGVQQGLALVDSTFGQRQVVILNSGPIFTHQKHRIFIEQGYNKHRPWPAGAELFVGALFTIAKAQVNFIGTE